MNIVLITAEEINNIVNIETLNKQKPTPTHKKKIGGYLNTTAICKQINREQAEVLLAELERRVSRIIDKRELYINLIDFNHPDNNYAIWKLNEMLAESDFYEGRSTNKQRDYIYALMNLTPAHEELIGEIKALNKQQASVLIDFLKNRTYDKFLQTDTILRKIGRGFLSVLMVLFYIVFGVFIVLFALATTKKK